MGDGTPSGSAQDISGGALGSDYSGSLSANYVVPMANGNSWYAGIDVNFTDSYLMTGDLDPEDEQEGFEKVNLRLGVRGDDWDLMFFGRNITNEITANWRSRCAIISWFTLPLHGCRRNLRRTIQLQLLKLS